LLDLDIPPGPDNLVQMKLQAYVFCGCFERGKVKRPPPNPKIVGILTNGDISCFKPSSLLI